MLHKLIVKPNTLYISWRPYTSLPDIGQHKRPHGPFVPAPTQTENGRMAASWHHVHAVVVLLKYAIDVPWRWADKAGHNGVQCAPKCCLEYPYKLASHAEDVELQRHTTHELRKGCRFNSGLTMMLHVCLWTALWVIAG